MTIDLDALEKLAKEATPGPWEISKYVDAGDGRYVIADGPEIGIGHIRVSRPYVSNGKASRSISVAERDGTAAFIAAANPDAVLELIAEIRRLRQQALADLMATSQCVGEHIWSGHPRYDAMARVVVAASEEAILHSAGAQNAGGTCLCGLCRAVAGYLAIELAGGVE